MLFRSSDAGPGGGAGMKLSTVFYEKHSGLRSVYGRCGQFAYLIGKILYPNFTNGAARRLKTGKSSAGKPEIGKSSAGKLRGNPACPRRAGASAFRLISAGFGPPDGPIYPQIFPELIAPFAVLTGAAGGLPIW